MVSDMMTAEQLKNSILQLAMQGKLVEQRPEEGTGEDLYKEIQIENKRLIREGKVKKKLLSDNEKDDIPFDIPDSWRWVRISEISAVINGDRGKNYPSKSTLSHEGIPFISALNLDGRTVVKDDSLLCVSQEQYDRLGSGKLEKGDIVVCIRGSLGKHGRYPFEKGAIASSLVICRQFIKSEAMALFIMSFLDAPLFFDQIKQYDNGTAQPNLAAKSLEQFYIPLPPLAEQKRILAKIEELMPFVEQYAATSTKLNTLNASFSEMMKKSILQEAVQGKLVEQRPEEGTGTELYEIIRNDKKSLMKSKIIKKEKPLPEIKEEDIPFDIPDSWVWVRIGLISNSLFAGGDKPKDFTEKPDRLRSIPVVANGVSNNGILGYTSVATAKANTITVAGRGTIGFSVFREYEYCPIVRLIVIEQNKNVFPQYLQYALQALPEKSLGTSIPQLTVPMLYPKLIPLPPLAEQKRIVAKIEELMPFITELGSGVK